MQPGDEFGCAVSPPTHGPALAAAAASQEAAAAVLSPSNEEHYCVASAEALNELKQKHGEELFEAYLAFEKKCAGQTTLILGVLSLLGDATQRLQNILREFNKYLENPHLEGEVRESLRRELEKQIVDICDANSRTLTRVNGIVPALSGMEAELTPTLRPYGSLLEPKLKIFRALFQELLSSVPRLHQAQQIVTDFFQLVNEAPRQPRIPQYVCCHSECLSEDSTSDSASSSASSEGLGPPKIKTKIADTSECAVSPARAFEQRQVMAHGRAVLLLLTLQQPHSGSLFYNATPSDTSWLQEDAQKFAMEATSSRAAGLPLHRLYLRAIAHGHLLSRADLAYTLLCASQPQITQPVSVSN